MLAVRSMYPWKAGHRLIQTPAKASTVHRDISRLFTSKIYLCTLCNVVTLTSYQNQLTPPPCKYNLKATDAPQPPIQVGRDSSYSLALSRYICMGCIVSRRSYAIHTDQCYVNIGDRNVATTMPSRKPLYSTSAVGEYSSESQGSV